MKKAEVCEEMQKLRDYLDQNKIPWMDMSDEYREEYADILICRTWLKYKDKSYSVINGFGTYGGIKRPKEENEGLLEVMSDDGIFGYLKAEDVIEMIEK